MESRTRRHFISARPRDIVGKEAEALYKSRAKDKVLVLLHGLPSGASTAELQEWTKYKVNFRRQVLEPLESALLVECDSELEQVVITPLGVQRVERDVLPAQP